MTGTGSRDGGRPRIALPALLPAVATLGLLVLVWAATTGPVGVMSGSGRVSRFSTRIPVREDSGNQTTGTLRQTTAHVRQTVDLSWLGTLVVAAVWLGLGLLAFLALRWAWRHRWRRPAPPPAVAFEVLPDAVLAETLAAGAESRLRAVAGGTPRNGIVACWVSLEDSVAEAGVRRSPAETSGELAVRVLHRLDVDPAAVGRLAALYREARFSEHEMGEDARAAAREALERVAADLGATRSSR